MSEKLERTTDKLKNELHGACDTMRVELDRLEILTAALSAFSQPIPDYEPDFHHLRHLTASAARL